MTPERFAEIRKIERRWAAKSGGRWVEVYTDINSSQGEKRRQLLAQVAKAIGISTDEFREWYEMLLDELTSNDEDPDHRSEEQLREDYSHIEP